MPPEAVAKIRQDPEAFKQFCKENGFEVMAVEFPKCKAVRIEIGFSESPHIQRNKAPAFNSMTDANVFFNAQNRDAEAARENGKLLGYYKTDFKITFEDGYTYNGRYDIGSDSPDLTSHVKSFAQCYSGRVKPGHMTDKQWDGFLHNHYVTDDSRKDFAFILDNYDLDS